MGQASTSFEKTSLFSNKKLLAMFGVRRVAVRTCATKASHLNASPMGRAVAKWDLNESGFYQAWNKGTLAESDLKLYSQEYHHFISSIPAGWEKLGNAEHAAEEVEHADLWAKFTKSLNTDLAPGKVDGMVNLTKTANKNFTSSEASAVGALYAFEVQQPSTSRTKLTGLAKHYSHLETNGEYFEHHADDYGEAKMLEEKFNAMGEKDKEVAVEACRETSKALWDALDSVYTGDKQC